MKILTDIKYLSAKIHPKNQLKRLQLEENLLMEFVFETKDLSMKALALNRKKEIDITTYKMLGE